MIPRRTAAPNVQPPPSGTPEVDLDVGEDFIALGIGGDDIAVGPSINGGTMRMRPGLDEEEHDTEPMAWTIPGWEEEDD